MLVRIANREEDPDQTASSDAVLSGSALVCLCLLGRQLMLESFRTFIVYQITCQQL